MSKIDFNNTSLSKLDRSQIQKLVGRKALFEPNLPGSPTEGVIRKVSPSGNRIRIKWETRRSSTWTSTKNIKFLEVLDEPADITGIRPERVRRREA